MVFKRVRRSGLLYRIVPSLAAVCFDCLLEVVRLATNTESLGLGPTVRNHDPLADKIGTTEGVGIFPNSPTQCWAAFVFELGSRRILLE